MTVDLFWIAVLVRGKIKDLLLNSTLEEAKTARCPRTFCVYVRFIRAIEQLQIALKRFSV